MFKKNWFNSWTGIKSSKQVHSLDNLKTLHNVLSKNQTVSEQNKHLLVETLRSIAEILIWGDQNDSTVFDFFLEKNMLSFFLKIMKQKCGSYVCVQLLQTLNILFENIRDETSLYYLLSNNHVNSIIVHKFDFSDEEVMAYYISFLKTLSFKLNDHTIHFFFNEHTNDFPLYTEAIKFFNHNEKMVRIAVRTLTLNVFKVDERSMLKFVGDHTAVPYFSNLVWFIGNHVLEIDACLQKPIKDQQMLIKLDDLVAEHLDHLHYLNDILLLRIDDLNEILTDHLLNRLLVPLYIYSLIAPGDPQASTPKHSDDEGDCRSVDVRPGERPRITRIVSLFLLSQVFLIISYDSLVQQLVDILLNGNCKIFAKPQFIAPHETLEESLVNNLFNRSSSSRNVYEDETGSNLGDEKLGDKLDEKLDEDKLGNDKLDVKLNEKLNEKLDENQNDELNNQSYPKEPDRRNSYRSGRLDRQSSEQPIDDSMHNHSNDELFNEPNSEQIKNLLMEEFFKDKPFLEALYKSFDCNEHQDDHLAVFSLSLLYAIIFNTGIKKSQLYMLNDNAQLITDQLGSSKLIDHITQTICLSASFDSFIRPVTLELCALLLLKLCIRPEGSVLSDHHLAIIEQTKENSTSVVRNYFRNENEQLFLDLFEDEYLEYSKFKINVEYLMMDANLLIPPRQLAPLMATNLHFTRRLPFSDIEKARYALRVFFIVRNLSMRIVNETDSQLPLTSVQTLISVGDSIDLNNCNLVHCFLQPKNQAKEEGYIVILDEQLVFVEPDNQRGIGSASAKYTANLLNVDVCLDKDDSRSLLVTIRPNAANGSQTKFGALDLSQPKAAGKHTNTNVKLLFDDYIRCKVTEQHISKGKQNVIQRKLRKIAALIDIQLESIPAGPNNNNGMNHSNRSTHRTYTLYSNSSRTTLKFGANQSQGLPVPGGAAMVANGAATAAATTTTETGKTNSKLPAVFGKRPSNHRNRSLSSSHKNSRESSKERSPADQAAVQALREEIMLTEMSPKNQRRRFNSEQTTNLESNELFNESLSVELPAPNEVAK